MDEYGHNSFPLTVAQRGLWMTQKIAPGAILNIAEAVEICGPISRRSSGGRFIKWWPRPNSCG